MVARVEPVAGRRAQRTWLHVFTVGLVLWVAATVVTVVTENSTLLPTVILLGSFLVPVTFVVWAYERRSAWLDEHMFLPLLRHRRRARLALVSLLGLAVLVRVLHSARLRASGDRAALDVGEQIPDRHPERP